ncbi:hypothetical protein MA16_Dca014561 [Dendrobium catenatum]|uniref:Uncharacterized protein n=1 Tax=Dendrobium catenatum TaxID=906689 RepID=A0A2I0XJN9_9ASPA|nr:hypothetical protein MA16_Dca014561 [Dendrobium catenatum]
MEQCIFERKKLPKGWCGILTHLIGGRNHEPSDGVARKKRRAMCGHSISRKRKKP